MSRSRKLDKNIPDFLGSSPEPYYRRFSLAVLAVGAAASLTVQALYLKDPEVLRQIPVVYDSARHFAVSEALAIGGVAAVGAAGCHMPRQLRTVAGETGAAMAVTAAANGFHELVIDANESSLVDVTSPTVVTGAIFGAAALALAVRNAWQQEQKTASVPIVAAEAAKMPVYETI